MAKAKRAKPAKAKTARKAAKPEQAADAPAVPNAPAVVDPPAVIPDPRKGLEDLGNIDPLQLENLNTDDLRRRMLTGIYLLEHALFSQAGFEFNRIQNLRSLIKKLEEDIFSPENLENMTEGEKLRLYTRTMGSMSTSLEFLSNLHKNVTLGIEAVNNIDRMKADRGLGPQQDTSDKSDLAAIKQQILGSILKKKGDPPKPPVEVKGESGPSPQVQGEVPEKAKGEPKEPKKEG
jgi:hypothetical protein